MSKKTLVKVLTIVLTIVVMLTIAVLPSFAITAKIGQVSTGAQSAIEGSETNKLAEVGGKIVGILQVLGMVIAIVVLLILGIKYMTGSAEEKAEYKKTMVPYAVGAVIVFVATTLVNVIYNAATAVTK